MIRLQTLCLCTGLLGLAAAHAATDDALFAQHARVASAAISPDGRYVATSQVFNGVSVLGLLDLSSMKVTNMGAREGAEIVDFDWAGDDRLIYSIGEHVGGIESPQPNGELYTVKGDGSGAKLVFGYRVQSTGSSASHIKHAEAEMASGSFVAALPDDPNYALISSYPLNHTVSSAANMVAYTDSFEGSFPELYRLDLRDGNKTRVLTAPLRRAWFVADHRGIARFVVGRGPDQKLKVLYRGSDKGDWQPVWDEATDKGEFVPLMFDRSNESVYVRCGTGAADAICRWDGATRKRTVLWTASDSSTAQLVPTFDGNDAFAIRTYPGRSATVLLDKTAPEAQLLVTLLKQFGGGEDIRFTSASRDGKKVLFVAQADVDPGVFYLYDADKKKISALFERRPGIKADAMAAMEPVTFKARDGLLLHGYVTRPRGKETQKDLPTVVVVHGGPYYVRDSWLFDPEVQLLAAHGYAVVQVNFRGSAGYGADFEAAGYREWGGNMQDDVTDATRWAIAQGIADPKRICIYGASYGGYAALEGAVKEPDLYRCAIGYVGVYDLRLMHSRGDTTHSSYGVAYLKQVLGDDEADLWNRSPMAHLDALKAQLMLVVGGADQRVPAVQGQNLHDALVKRGVSHEWVFEPNEGHGFFDERHVAALQAKIVAFLDRNIGSGASAAPAASK